MSKTKEWYMRENWNESPAIDDSMNWKNIISW
jgi:hypothetical protein